jgi:hypothetical protein
MLATFHLWHMIAQLSAHGQALVSLAITTGMLPIAGLHQTYH